MDNLYQGEKSKKLDPRAMFIVQGSKGPLYIWQGGNIPNGNIQTYMNFAQSYCQNLQQYERASPKIQIVHQG